MYFNVVKRTVESKNYVKIVKMIPCYGYDDDFSREKAQLYCNIRNMSRIFQDKYYYVVEFDFE